MLSNAHPNYGGFVHSELLQTTHRHGFGWFDRILVMNLKSRTDRLAEITNVFKSVNVSNFTVIPAVRHECPMLGCALANILAIENCIASNVQICLFLDDDFTLRHQASVASKLVDNFFLTATSHRLHWDVLLISAGIIQSTETSFPGIIRVMEAQAGSGYAVRRHFLKRLQSNFLAGAAVLNTNCGAHETHASDQHWKLLMPRFNFYAVDPLVGKQKPGFSDTQNKFVNYTA